MPTAQRQLRSILAATAGIEEMVEEPAGGGGRRLARAARRTGRHGSAWSPPFARPACQIVEVGEIGSDLEATFLRPDG